MIHTGWVRTSETNAPPFSIKKEMLYFFKRVLIDSLMFLPLILFVLYVFLLNYFFKRDKISMLFGTHPIITFNILSKTLNSKYDTTLFVFDDYSNGNFHEGITLKDITPKFLTLKSSYFLGSYISFFWALKKFDIFHLYFDAGFLERTLWWRLEPLVYQLLEKKVILYPYGTDAMTLFNNNNLAQKIGHIHFSDKYFDMDFKRIKRNYWWCKYVDLVIGYAPYIKFLPRFDLLIWHGQISLDNNELNVELFSEKKKEIKILHFANHKVRKGSYFIEKKLDEICAQYNNVNYECIEGVSREEALKKLDKCDIFIDSLIDGFFQFSSLDAMLRGKVTLSFYEEQINDVFKQLKPEYYRKFIENFPVVNINVNTLEENLVSLIENPKKIEILSQESHVVSRKMVKENINSYKKIIDGLVNR